MPPLLAGLLWLLDHWQAKPGEIYRSGPPMRFGWLLSLSYLGAATHPLLDLLTTYSVQLLSPLSNAWYHADGLFIIDVWLWLLLGGSIFWSKRRERSGGDWRKAPQTAIAAGLAYILLNLLISERAHAAVKRTRDLAPKEQRAAIFASPQPILFWRRQLAWRDGRYNRRGRYDPIGGGLDITCCRHDWNNMDHPLVRRARIADPKLAKYLRWSILPEAEVQGIDRCTAQVTVGDARYGESASTSRIKHVSLVPTGQPGC
jgi:inner membrane protein